jgi:uncharacterized SAM-binding protein YcdF (DUF218 family)
LLGILGVILLATRFAGLGRKLLIASMLLLAICGFLPLGNLLLYPLENRFPRWDAARGTPDGIIVLGGPIDADLSAAHDTPVISSAPDRIVAAAELARKYPNARVVFTGGSSNLISNDAREADFAAEIFEALGIDKKRLILERRSRNTYENATFSKALVAPKPGERWLLVTSAFHMPRAVGLFRNGLCGRALSRGLAGWGRRGCVRLLASRDRAGANRHRKPRVVGASGLSSGWPHRRAFPGSRSTLAALLLRLKQGPTLPQDVAGRSHDVADRSRHQSPPATIATQGGDGWELRDEVALAPARQGLRGDVRVPCPESSWSRKLSASSMSARRRSIRSRSFGPGSCRRRSTNSCFLASSVAGVLVWRGCASVNIPVPF